MASGCGHWAGDPRSLSTGGKPRALTLAYRLPGRGRRLGLVVQRIDFAALGVPVIRPDMTAGEFRRGWRSVPALQRMAILCITPPYALLIALLGTRRFIARHLGQEDLPGSADEQLRQSAGQFTELVLDRRDAMLVDALASIHEARCGEQIDLAVVWGAGHIPAVTHQLLARYGYCPRSAEWLTVFDF